MATYKTPKYTPLQEAGTAPVKQTHKANVSVAHQRSDEYPGVKTSGIVTRGNGAATKGKTARGPMA